jgi:hypothetical protein
VSLLRSTASCSVSRSPRESSTGSAITRTCLVTPSGRCNRNAADACRCSRRTVCTNPLRDSTSSGWACAAISDRGTAPEPGSRPYSEYSCLFRMILPLCRFSSKPPTLPSRWACCSRFARRAVSSCTLQMTRTSAPCRVMLTLAVTVSGTGRSR